MTIQPPYLKDANGGILNFPANFFVRSESISRRSSFVQMPFSHLSRDAADGCFNPRRIEVSGLIYAETEDTARTLLDTVLAFSFRKGLELWFKGRRIKVDKILDTSIQDNGKKGFLYQVSFAFQAGDPFWYSEEKQISPSSNPYEFSIGGTAETYPRLKLTMSGSASSINISVNGQNCYFILPVASGDVLEIDSYSGAVKLNGVDKLGNFSGRFPKLIPGQNSIELAGGQADVTIYYSEAFI